jgi:hypothetical protein
MASSGPPPSNSIIQKPPQNELVDAVRHWVHFDNLAETLNKQVSNVRTKRSEYEEKILKHLDSHNMRDAVLQISGAQLQRASTYRSANLSWTLLEEQLHEFYKTHRKPDETAAIVDFLQKHRGGKSVDYLKKTQLGSEKDKKK